MKKYMYNQTFDLIFLPIQLNEIHFFAFIFSHHKNRSFFLRKKSWLFGEYTNVFFERLKLKCANNNNYSNTGFYSLNPI